MENNKHYIAFGLILGLSLVISATIGSLTFYKLRSMDYISTTGSAKKPVVSDQVKWATTITRAIKQSTIKDGYTKLDADLKEVKAFFATNDVQKISDLSKNTSSLVTEKGVLFSTSSLEYYYSNLPAIRVELLANAVGDAKARAEQLAKAGGKSIGPLQSASSGVVQVMAPNSVEVSDYGMYDTSSINKEIMVTVKASFEIK